MEEIKTYIFCSECDSELMTNLSYNVKEQSIDIEVIPCEKCMGNKYDEGYKTGMDEGL